MTQTLQTVDIHLTTGSPVLSKLVGDDLAVFANGAYLTMRNQTVLIAVLLCAMLQAIPLLAGEQKASNDNTPQVFMGEIMDSLCAKDGTHEKMMDEMKSMGRDKNTCAVKCAQLGAQYVLYDAVKKEIYSLDDQEKAEAFAGRRVRVSGTLKKNKLKVETITGLD